MTLKKSNNSCSLPTVKFFLRTNEKEKAKTCLCKECCLRHTLIWICYNTLSELFITERTSTINGLLNSTSEAQTSANPSPSSVKHITLGKQTYIHKVVITLEN